MGVLAAIGPTLDAMAYSKREEQWVIRAALPMSI
jgi:hypothetical protein